MQRRADADPLKLSLQEDFSPRQLKIQKLTTKVIDIKKVNQVFFLDRKSPLVRIYKTVLRIIFMALFSKLWNCRAMTVRLVLKDPNGA